MQFKDLKAGCTLYVYDRQEISLQTKTITSVSIPRMEKVNNVPVMVVDVATDGKTYSFKDTDEIGCFGSLLVSSNKDLILREVEGQKTNNNAILGRVDALKAELPKLDAVVDMLNPDAKEKKQNEERLTRLEESIGALKEMVELFVKQKPNGSK